MPTLLQADLCHATPAMENLSATSPARTTAPNTHPLPLINPTFQVHFGLRKADNPLKLNILPRITRKHPVIQKVNRTCQKTPKNAAFLDQNQAFSVVLSPKSPRETSK
jgi:hypothetical protein